MERSEDKASDSQGKASDLSGGREPAAFVLSSSNLQALWDWCEAHLLKRYNIRVGLLPATGRVRVWIQMVNRKGNISLRRASGEKVMGEAIVGCSVDRALDRAAGQLLESLQEEGAVAMARGLATGKESLDGLPMFENTKEAE